jgi:hypothetical protein
VVVVVVESESADPNPCRDDAHTHTRRFLAALNAPNAPTVTTLVKILNMRHRKLSASSPFLPYSAIMAGLKPASSGRDLRSAISLLCRGSA